MSETARPIFVFELGEASLDAKPFQNGLHSIIDPSEPRRHRAPHGAVSAPSGRRVTLARLLQASGADHFLRTRSRCRRLQAEQQGSELRGSGDGQDTLSSSCRLTKGACGAPGEAVAQLMTLNRKLSTGWQRAWRSPACRTGPAACRTDPAMHSSWSAETSSAPLRMPRQCGRGALKVCPGTPAMKVSFLITDV